MRHNPVTQISRLSPQSLHKEYERWCDGAREHPIDENCFRGIFYTTKALLQIVMRTSKQGSTQCWLCSLFGEFKKTAVGFAEKAWVEDLKTKHALFHAEETRLYEQDAFEGKDPGGHTLSINADGAASHAHTIPKVAGRVPKSMPEWHQKLQGLVVHGHALNLFNIFHGVKGGANMFLTALLRTFQLLGKGLPHIVKLRIDGGSEGWNAALLAVVDLLFDIYPELNEFYVSRFAVGHTHADLDRFFGYLNQILFGTAAGGKKAGEDVPTREEFKRLCLETLKTKKDTMLLEHHMEDLLFAYDFWALIKPYLNPAFQNYGATGPIHVWRFKRQPGLPTPHVSYKYWSQSTQWLPADGSSVKVFNRRFNLLDAKAAVCLWVKNCSADLVPVSKKICLTSGKESGSSC